MGRLKFLSYRELRSSTSQIREALTGDGKIIVTNNGKPEALMLQVSETNLEETLALLSQLKLARAINNLRQASQDNSIADMSMEEIDQQIAQSRQERKVRQVKAITP
ncbi:MAG: type II toxin-antitoxin system Phd/YefM family antitoxin [Clostridiales bacterium]|nr:type II toxin-antitoxin system Phd/YefM family antitoxin [Clostridiales bacterium]